MRLKVKVSNITCANCARTIEDHFNVMTDIKARVLVTSGSVIFNFNNLKYDLKFIHEELLKIGYYAVKNNADEIKNKKKDLVDIIVAGIFMIPLLMTMLEHFQVFTSFLPKIFMDGYFQLIITTPILFYSGRRFFYSAYKSIIAKNLGMDALVVLGTLSAYIFSIFQIIFSKNKSHDLYFETTAVIIFMVLIGNYFENRMKMKTNSTLMSLLSLKVETAIKIDNTKEIEVDIKDVKIGDILLVKGYAKVPIDGIVVEGKTYIDESMITGEPMPVSKTIGDYVTGMSMNIMESIKIKVNRVGSDTIFAKIVEMVEEASLIKPRIQKIADKISKVFVPIVILISISVLLFYLFIQKKPFSSAISPAISILVVSCPCALGLATPTSISVSSGMAFKKGILYKGGEFFELAGKIDAFAFDKTGTITSGIPKVSNYIGDLQYLKYTASLEYHSIHPISKAIINYYDSQDYFEVLKYENLIGYGIKGKIEGSNVYVVSIKYILENQIKIPDIFNEYQKIQEEGKTIFFTIINDNIVSMIGVADEIRSDAINLINNLKKRNIKTYMITGDNEKTANYVAEKVEIDILYSDVLPHQKAEIISEIKQENKVVAFIGDGINDAPALKIADISFSVSKGSQIALESSDVSLINDDLLSTLYAIDLSKATIKNIYLSFFWAFVYNICMIPLAAINIFSPMLAGIGMAFSSFMVILNALSLNLWKGKKYEKNNS